MNPLHPVEPNAIKCFFLKPEPNESNDHLILGCKRARVKANLPLIWGSGNVGIGEKSFASRNNTH